MKSYDLDEIKARLPDYLHAIGTEVFFKGSDRITAACPIHDGTKRNFHAVLMTDGIWLWNCRSGCGGQGGTTLDLHAKIHGLSPRQADCISGAAQVLNLQPNAEKKPRQRSLREQGQRLRETQDRLCAEEKQKTLTATLTARRGELLAPYESDDWRADFFHESPFDLSTSHDGQTRQILEWLFDPDNLVWMGDTFESGKPIHRNNFRPARAWLETDSLPQRISAGIYRHGSFSRCQANLIAEPFLIVESDDLIGHKPESDRDREENRRLNAALMRFLVERFHLELRAIIDTGGKSLHGWFAHPGKETKNALSRLLDGLAIDQAVFARASCAPLRAPGCLHRDTELRASLYYLNPIS